MDISRYLANHLVGEHHTMTHRRTVGVVIILAGTAIGGMMHDAIHTIVLKSVLDYTIMPSFHCLGAIPFLTPLEKKANTKTKKRIKNGEA